MTKKFKSCIIFILIWGLLFSLSACNANTTVDIQASSDNPSSISNSDISSNIMTIENATNLLEDLNLTEKQLRNIYSMIYGLSEAEITYSFDSIEEINPSQFPNYFSYRAYDYFEPKLDDEMKMALNKKQIEQILKGDFGVDEIPFYMDEKLTATVQFGLQGRGYWHLNAIKNDNIVQVEIAPFYDDYKKGIVIDKIENLDYSITYTFEIVDDENVILKSGKMSNKPYKINEF